PLTQEALADDRLIGREIARVELHRRSICALLERHDGHARSILDVGCGTGATTIALAMSDGLGAERVVGIDPNASALEAAKVRARGHDVDPARIEFRHVEAGAPFPTQAESFDLVVCVSVLEYLGTRESRRAFAAELLRAARPGGVVCLATPNPFRLFDYHT